MNQNVHLWYILLLGWRLLTTGNFFSPFLMPFSRPSTFNGFKCLISRQLDTPQYISWKACCRIFVETPSTLFQIHRRLDGGARSFEIAEQFLYLTILYARHWHAELILWKMYSRLTYSPFAVEISPYTKIILDLIRKWIISHKHENNQLFAIYIVTCIDNQIHMT